MPKEMIPSETNPPGTSLAVVVAWGRDSEVQMASVNPDNEATYGPEYGWFTTLNRQGINRLIRTLRKARDQAYGADE